MERIENCSLGYKTSSMGVRNQPQLHLAPKSAGKEEFNDWPRGLFAIGTLGNDKSTENPERNLNPQQQQNLSASTRDDLTPEEIGNLQEELMSLLGKQEENELPVPEELTRFSQELALQYPRKGGILQCTSKTSLSLLRKIFVCRSGFPPIPASLRDPPPEPGISKILRAMLKKKIYPSQALSNKRSLENNQQTAKVSAKEDEANKEASPGSKWVRTDSEYIVLEI
ncbi:hypothetical protein CRG98_027578 [Punica granatum]|uniref:Uncharacterized protein n=1 Tax=Punica granatum TaxID=22663 RepID=A0A2I0J729_PUNGR|nr:hypothetical protein CRG98_027578 [Punica granatum]